MKKRVIPALFSVLLLTGCGYQTEDMSEMLPTGQVFVPAEDITEEEIPDSENAEVSGFPEFDDITEEQIISLALSDAPNADRIPDYDPPQMGNLVYIPEGEELENWVAHQYANNVPELITETDLYAVYQISQSDEQGSTTAEQILIPKNFRMSGNDYARYSGGMDETAVLQNFDIISRDETILCRRYRDDPEIKCISYDFYAVRMTDENTAEFGWYCYLIDRDDMLVCTIPEWNRKWTVSLSDVEPAPPEQEGTQAPDDEILYDIRLWTENPEILIGQDEEIIWNAEIPADCQPEQIQLINADTGETEAELFDIADDEIYGDTIMGDSVYHCRFAVDTDFATDPDVSEDKYYHYYAEFTENGQTHRSDTADIWVVEQFTDKELEDMEAVDDSISVLMESEAYQNLSLDEKRDRMLAVLEDLAANGTENRPYSLIYPESIYDGGDTISFAYICGISGGIMLTDFADNIN